MEQRAEDTNQHQLEESDPEILLPPRRVAALIGVEESTLAAWRKRGSGPPWYRIQKHLIRYDKGEVLTWIHSQRYGEPESVPADQSETDRPRSTTVRFQFPREVAKIK